DRMRMSSQAPRGGSPPLAGGMMTLRVPCDRPLPLAGRHAFSSRGRHPLTAPAASLFGSVPVRPHSRATARAHAHTGCPPHSGSPHLTRRPAVERLLALGYDSTAPGGVPEWLK